MKSVAVKKQFVSNLNVLPHILITISFLLFLCICAEKTGQNPQQVMLAPSSTAGFPRAKTIVVYI
jgi:hypothetical protein